MPFARACIGSPFPRLPWKTTVLACCGSIQVPLALIDVGPSGGLASKAIIDITLEGWQALLARKLQPSDVNTLERQVSFIVLGGAKYLDGYKPHGATTLAHD